MFIGGSAGSTAGGMKVIRIIIIFKTILSDLLRSIHPQAVTPLKIGDRVIPEKTRAAILGLLAAWLLVFVVGTFLVAIQPDLDLVSSATAVAATLNVIGPGLGQVGASESYEAVNYFGRVILTLCMVLGRLEILTALALLSPAF
jgi:trk system potassium uptake protein TrkH